MMMETNKKSSTFMRSRGDEQTTMGGTNFKTPAKGKGLTDSAFDFS